MAKNTSFAAFLARRATSDAAHRAVLQSGLNWPTAQLALNPAISEEIWQQLAALRGNVDVTQNLTVSKLSEDKIRLLLKDKRITIQERLFTDHLGSISYELAEEIANSKLLTQRSAEWWIDAGTVPRALLTKVAQAAGGYRLVKSLADSELFTEREVLKVLSKLDKDYMNRLWLPRLFDLRPELIKEALKIDRLIVLEALASCRHIFNQADFLSILSKVTVVQKNMDETKLVSAARDPFLVRDVLLELMNNPNTSTEIADKAYSALSPSYYLDLPSFHRYLKRVNAGKPKDVVTIDWQTLNLEQQKKLLSNLNMVEFRYPTLEYVKSLPVEKEHLHPPYKEPRAYRKNLATLNAQNFYPDTLLPKGQLLKEVQAPLDAKGQEAWSTLLALAPDWESSIQSLIETTLGLVS